MSPTAQVDLAALLDDAAVESRALVIQGPPGIGKTHLWSGILREASGRGWRPLRARPSQAERRLVGSALIDLCEGVDDDELAALPGAQHMPLAAALLRSGAREVVDPHAVAVAFTTLVRQLARNSRVILAIDDIQWLDAQTESVLEYAVRRLPETGVLLLAARRIEHDHPEPALIADIGTFQVERYDIAPLEPADIERAVADALRTPVSKPILRRVIELSGGNPLYAIELARSLVNGREALPDSLVGVVADRITMLDAASRMTLAAAAALRRPSVHQLRELGLDLGMPSAERAGIVRLEESAVVFEHPLYAAAAYDMLTGSERMALHARLATVVDGAEERARHLALGSDEPSEDVAVALDQARERALARGALDAATDAARLAVRVSLPASDGIVDRRVAYSRLLLRTGNAVGARAQVDEALESARGVARARVMLELSNVTAATDSWTAAAEVLRPAVQLAADEPSLLTGVLIALANFTSDLDMREGVRLADAALEVLERTPNADPALRAQVLTQRASARFITGHGLDRASFDEAVRIERSGPPRAVKDRAEWALGSWLVTSDQIADGREILMRLEREAAEEGDDISIVGLRSNLFTAEIKAGRWDDAAIHAEHAIAAARRAGTAVELASARICVAFLHAQRGELDDAEAIARAVLAELPHIPFFSSLIAGLLGYCALERGDAAAAIEHLRPVIEEREKTGRCDPGLRRVDDEVFIEALIAVGQGDEAARWLGRLEARASAVDRRAMLAVCARLRALHAAARGETEQALDEITGAMELWDGLDMPVIRARALLVKGQLHRRLRQKALARAALTEACTVFDRVGATLHAARARDEIARVGLRPPAPLELTETERRVAHLAAEGKTRADIAAALFISPHTVAANLTRVYRKTGTRNRAELVRYLSVPE